MQFVFSGPDLPESGSVVVAVFANRQMGQTAARLDQQTDGALGRALSSGRFTGKKDETLVVAAPSGTKLDRILLAGFGEAKEIDRAGLQGLGGVLWQTLNANGATEATMIVDAPDGAAVAPADMAAEIAYGARLRAYRFDKYRTKLKPEQKPSLETLTLGSAEPNRARAAVDQLDARAAGVDLTRDLLSEPPHKH